MTLSDDTVLGYERMFPTRYVHTNETHVSYTLRSHT